MKHQAKFRSIGAVAVAVALGASACGSGDGEGDGDGDDGAALACDSVAFCSSWWVTGTQVAALPAPVGGAIPDGTYALIDALAVETSWTGSLQGVLQVDGGRFRNTSDAGPGASGTLSVDGSNLTFTPTRGCGIQGEDFGDEVPAPVTYAYTVDGDDLLVFVDDRFSLDFAPITVALVLRRTTGELCDAGGTVSCTIDTCFCATATGGLLPDTSCGG